MEIKENLKKKFEKKIIKSELDGKVVYLGKGTIFGFLKAIPGIKRFAKGMDEWHQVYPPINEDGSANISNIVFGGWRNLVKLIIIMSLLFLAYFQFSVLLGDSKEYMDGDKYVILPRGLFNKYCSTAIEEYPEYESPDYFSKINLSEIIIKDG